MGKKRIDILLIEQNLARSSKHAAALLMSGRVFVNRQRVSVPGMLVDPLARISIKAQMPYVSRGGYKLAAALDAFTINPAGAVCADVGASTGGFTDVLLQRGAKKVYALDVGYGHLAWKLRQDPRVAVMERTNARHVERLPQPVSLVVIDVSFISLKRILPAAQKWIEPRADFAVLVKPQFEAPKAEVKAGGVVKNRATHAAVLKNIIDWCGAGGLAVLNAIPSPVLGPAGNKEFLLHLRAGGADRGPGPEALVAACLHSPPGRVHR